jgi:hypothetical protein
MTSRATPAVVGAVDDNQQERTLVPATMNVARAAIDFGHVLDTVLPKPKLTFRIQVRRPADLLVFDAIFNNLKLATGASPRLERADASAYLTIEFPPQSFGEEALLEAATATANGNGEPKLLHDKGFSSFPRLSPLPTWRIRMAGRSRIVLSMPVLGANWIGDGRKYAPMPRLHLVPEAVRLIDGSSRISQRDANVIVLML